MGAGFNPEYTGIENIYLNGTLMGYTNKEIEERIDDILEFADIGDFIYQPVKTYSSGMFARLAFAVSINVNPDILIVDEALSVGDIRFQQKCFRKMEEIKKNKTVIMVTHDMGAVTKFCDSVIWIEKGVMQDVGDPVSIVKKYQAYLMDLKLDKGNESHKSVSIANNYELEPITDQHEFYGTQDSIVTGIGLFDSETDEKIQYLTGNKKVKLILSIKNQTPLINGIVGFTVFDRLGNNIFSLNSFLSDDNVDTEKQEIIYECEFVFPELNEGVYTISPAIACGTQAEHIMLHWVYDAYELHVVTPYFQTLPGILAVTDYNFNKVE